DRPPNSVIYYPYWQRYYAQSKGESILALYVRTVGPATIVSSIRERVRNVDPEVSVSDRGPLGDIVSNSVSQRRFQAWMVAALGLVALLLAGIGVYGVVSYSLEQRRKEMGVRIALGASQQNITYWVLDRGMRPVAAGIAIGLVAAELLAPLIES